jgi:DNA-binding NarL/FixJ family response regulator
LVRICVEARLEQIVCDEAVDGLDAIQHARNAQPDVIILDLTMPKMNGLDAAAALQRILPAVPVILYTLHKDIDCDWRVQSFGIRAVVSKLDSMDVLLEQVLRYVGTPKAASA